jgi:hypothetical protein
MQSATEIVSMIETAIGLSLGGDRWVRQSRFGHI